VRLVSRREAILSAAVVFAVALAARAVAAAIIVFPKPEDTSYYVEVARHLLEGRGLVSDALWSYGTPPLVFPRPAFEVWLPLPTFLAAVPMALFGSTFAAAQVSSVLIGALVPVLAWRLAADVADELALPVGRARTLALGAGLTAAAYLPLVLHSALPDSTMPFAAAALGACLLMTRILRDPRGAYALDPRLLGLGVLVGLAALTRNEVIWLALTWAALAWFTSGFSTAARGRLIGVVAVVSLVLFAPWAIRNWVEFGSPLPGQAATNALSVEATDIFAWADPPTLGRYLAEGPARLAWMRVEGIGHNLFNVLLLLGIPVAVIGLVGMPWFARARALRPLLLTGVLTFTVTSLVFPVSTTWGTFLHAAGPVHVLLIVVCLVALDAGIARLGRARGWTRPVAWLGPALAVFGSVVLSVALLPAFGRGSIETRDRFRALELAMAEAGLPLGADEGPVITDFPIWLADTTGNPSLALPEEPPADVLDLARAFPGTRAVIVLDDPDGDRLWPGVLAERGPSSECFAEVPLPRPADPALADALDGTRVFRIGCP
jgi:hypothetical protein